MLPNIADKVGTGITVQQFKQQMTKNQEPFQQNDESFSWYEGTKPFFQNFQAPEDLRCGIIAADWCGDVIRNVPVVLRIVEEAGVPIEMFVLEEHEDLITRFLTLGGRSVPVVLFYNDEGEVFARWGPRPQYVQEPMVTFKQENPDPDASDYAEKRSEVYAEIHRRYGENNAHHRMIIEELQDILSKIK